MGLSGISVTSLLLILMIAMLLFGTKKLRSVGSDLGSAVRSFRDGMNEATVKDNNNENTVEEKQK